MMLYGFTVGMVGAALRLGLIQHFEGQTIIHDLKPVIRNTIRENIDRRYLNVAVRTPNGDCSDVPRADGL